MTFRKTDSVIFLHIISFIKWSLAGMVLGILGGLVGAGFYHTLHFVTALRNGHPWLICLLPLGGLITVGLYRLLGLEGNRGTNEVIHAVNQEGDLNIRIAPGIFLAAATTHLFGGSAGREGAALQLGGSIGANLAGLLRWQEGKKILTLCGMSAVFAGVFGTPLTAAVFTLEFASVGTVLTPALLPCYLAAFVATCLANALGVAPETAVLAPMAMKTAGMWLKLLVLAVAISLLGILMCRIFHGMEHLTSKVLPNHWVRAALGGGLVAVGTLLVGDMRYNGAGMDMALLAVEGQADWYDWLLKLLLTALTISAGLKGGEIVPTFCIGATFGCLLGSLLGLEPGVAAALGLVGLFCCVTNSPLAAVVLSVELFGSTHLGLFALICVIGFVLSGRSGLYEGQIQEFSKTRMTRQ